MRSVGIAADSVGSAASRANSPMIGLLQRVPWLPWHITIPTTSWSGAAARCGPPARRRPARCSPPIPGSSTRAACAATTATGRALAAGASSCGSSRASSRRFRDAVTAALPRDGRWFPRVDLVGARRAGRCRAARPAAASRAAAGARGARAARRARRPARLPAAQGARPPAAARPARASAGRRRRRARAARRRRQAARGRAEQPAVVGGRRALLDARRASRCRASPAGCCSRSRARAGVEVRRRSPLPCELDGREAWLANARTASAA